MKTLAALRTQLCWCCGPELNLDKNQLVAKNTTSFPDRLYPSSWEEKQGTGCLATGRAGPSVSSGLRWKLADLNSRCLLLGRLRQTWELWPEASLSWREKWLGLWVTHTAHNFQKVLLGNPVQNETWKLPLLPP